jgi:hypothetical protein
LAAFCALARRSAAVSTRALALPPSLPKLAAARFFVCIRFFYTYTYRYATGYFPLDLCVASRIECILEHREVQWKVTEGQPEVEN